MATPHNSLVNTRLTCECTSAIIVITRDILLADKKMPHLVAFLHESQKYGRTKVL